MNRTSGRKILRDLMSRKARTFLVSASIFIGVLGVIALFTTRTLINRQLAEDIQQRELSMIEIAVSVNKGTPLDNKLYLDTLNRRNEAGNAIPALEGIERVEGLAFYFIDFQEPGTDNFLKAELRAYSESLRDVQIEPMQLKEGAWAQAGQNQVMVEFRFAEKNGFKVGDPIVLRAANANGFEDVTYTISGFVFHPYSYRGITGDIPGPDVGIYAEYADAQKLLNFTGFSDFVARYATFELAREHYEGLQQAISDISPYVPTFPTFEDPAANAQVANAEIYNSLLTTLALVTMVVSGFLVINVINTIAVEQRKQIGAMKAIGATGLENFMMYSGIALAYGIIGTILAIMPGILIGYAMTSYLAPSLDIVIDGFGWSPQAVVIGIVMGLLVPILAAAVPVYNGVRVKIVDAITDLGISGQYGHGLISRLLGSLPLPISIKQALSNVYEKRWRLMLTGITLTLTIATFMGTLAVTVALQRELNNLFSRLGYHVTVQPNEVQDQATMETLLADIEGVDHTSPASLIWIQIEGNYTNFFTGNNQLQIYGLDPSSDALHFDYREGDGWNQNPNTIGIIPSLSVATQLEVGVGDEITFAVGGKRISREVLGIDSNAFDAANMTWQDLAILAGVVANAPHPNEYILSAALPNRTETVTVVGVDETLLTFLVPQGSNGGVLISQSLAEAQNVQEGDTLPFTIGDQTGEREIIAVVDNAILERSAQQALPTLTTVPDDLILFGFNDLVGFTGESLEGEPVPNAYYVTVANPDASVDEVDEVIENINNRLLAEGISSRYTNQVAAAEAFKKQVSTNTSVVSVATILIAAVGAIGLLTTLSIAVLERQKEIGVMRSIGASSFTVATQFLIEGLIVGFLAWLIGIPISYLLALGLYDVFGLDSIPFTYPINVLLTGFIGIMVICAIASLGPSLGAARKTVSDILRYQ